MHTLPQFGFLMGKSPMELFVAGGHIMWPMLFLSLLAMTVSLERLFFILRERTQKAPSTVSEILRLTKAGEIAAAAKLGSGSVDMLGRILGNCLSAKKEVREDAFAESASQEIARYQQGLSVLDTAITAAPLLGLLGTVIGMMGSFGEISGELGAPTAITGGIAEALVATATGLFIAIMCLMPYNYFNTRIEEVRRTIEEHGNRLEIALTIADEPPQATDANDAGKLAVSIHQETKRLPHPNMKPIVPPLKKSARLEIVPLIDVIFFLLATFILVSLTMTQQPGVRVELPLSKTSEPHELTESVTVTISHQGGVFWDETMVSFDRFLTELIRYEQTCKIDGVQARILLNADRGASYGQVATILDEIRKAGISKVTIETKVRAS